MSSVVTEAAIEAAIEGDAMTDQDGILSLPAELRLEVFRYTLSSSAKDLRHLLMTCKAMRLTFQSNVEKVLSVVLDKLPTEVLAIGTAHFHATGATWKYDKNLEVAITQTQVAYLQHVRVFCSQFLGKQGTELSILRSSFTLPMIAHIQAFHIPIQRMAARLATAFVRGRKSGPKPSPTEAARVSKALWIIDLVRILFPKSPVTASQHGGTNILYHDYAFTHFWNCFAP